MKKDNDNKKQKEKNKASNKNASAKIAELNQELDKLKSLHENMAKKPKKSNTQNQKKTKVDQNNNNKLPSKILRLPLIPIREGVLFPYTESVLTFGRQASLRAIKVAVKNRSPIILVTQKKSSIDNPKSSDLYKVGTLAVIEKTLKTEETISSLVRGTGRVEILEIIKKNHYYTAKVQIVPDKIVKDNELTALIRHLQKIFKKIVQLGKPVEFLNFMKLMSGVTEGEIVDQIASTLNLSTKKKQQILEMHDVKKRIKKVISYLSHEMKVLEIEKDVVHKTQKKFDKHMRESILRERIKTIQKELGDIEDDEELSQDYLQQLKKIRVKKEIKQKISKEIKRLKQMSVNNPEAGYIRSWLDTMFDLPWNKYNTSKIEIKKAEKILNKNHFGLKKIKERILEYISVLQLKKQNKKQNDSAPTILCFVGPPGVGKTSIGKSIAEALNRKFTKISLGGIKDEAEIRGHRRTYVGAMTGRIIKGIIQAESMNPVFMLDEVDKIGQDFRGDPSSALLEVLDPEQNHEFEDHYLDVPFNLSNVLFITTANTLDTIPSALRDRLEIIRFPGYTYEEKFNIAKKHLLERVIERNGLQTKQISISDKIINKIIHRYTKEAGVRELERTLSKISRKTARKILESKKKSATIKITEKKLKDFLGPEKYDITFTERKDQVGIATGLAWTRTGGDILFIEVSLSPGKGKIILTGKLGDVMKESAQAAYTYVKSNAKKLGIRQTKIDKTDIHIHVPEGAVPKDGPSAGITITTAIVSAFTGKKVKKDIAMTGEVTLTGRVLRIGGLKEKVIASHLAGCKTVLIPQSNKRDLIEIPKSAKKTIKFKPVEHVDQVLELALADYKLKL